MQTLGLSDSTPRSESRLRALFWPTIRNETDLDYITRQGFWICNIVAGLGLAAGIASRQGSLAAFESLFFLLAGVGVRQRSRTAAVCAFTAYFLSSFVLLRYTGQGFGIPRIIAMALLLSNVRGMWAASWWQSDPDLATKPEPMNQTFGDWLTDRFPSVVWPWARYLFYVLAVLELGFIVIALLAPRP